MNEKILRKDLERLQNGQSVSTDSVVKALLGALTEPAVVARTYNVGDILRSREDHSVTIRLTSPFSKDSWWVLSKSDGTRVGAWALNLRTLDSDYEPVPVLATVPARKLWLKGPFRARRLASGDMWAVDTASGAMVCAYLLEHEAVAIALALNEFPAAVAIIRESAKRGYQSSAIQFITRVDAAGFDMLVFTAEKEQKR